jgi:hypothetical protein
MGAVSPKDGRAIHCIKVGPWRMIVNSPAGCRSLGPVREPARLDTVGRRSIFKGAMYDDMIIARALLHPRSSTARLAAPTRAAG